MKKLRYIALFTSVLLAGGCENDDSRQAGAQATSVRIIAEPLQFDRTRTRLEAVGTSRAMRSAEIHPVTSGEVVAVEFQPGQRVERGDILLKLDSREQEIAVSLARVRLQDAERLYDRYQRSSDSAALLPTTLDAAKTAAETAQLELEQAQVELDYRTVMAPFGGYVDITEVDPGDRINPDTVITTVDDRDSLLIIFEVPEAQVADVRVGDQVDVMTWAGRSDAVRGEIVEIGSRINVETRTFTARARVPNESDELRPGMSFRVAINIEGSSYPVIAETALQWGADGAYIWSVVEGQAKRLNVDVIQRQQGKVLFEADIKEGSLVVVEGVQRMRNGTDVNVTRSVAGSTTED